MYYKWLVPMTGSSNGLGHCIVFLDETFYRDCSSSYPGVLLTSKVYHKLKLLTLLASVFFFAIDLHLNGS